MTTFTTLSFNFLGPDLCKAWAHRRINQGWACIRGVFSVKTSCFSCRKRIPRCVSDTSLPTKPHGVSLCHFRYFFIIWLVAHCILGELSKFIKALLCLICVEIQVPFYRRVICGRAIDSHPPAFCLYPKYKRGRCLSLEGMHPKKLLYHLNIRSCGLFRRSCPLLCFVHLGVYHQRPQSEVSGFIEISCD